MYTYIMTFSLTFILIDTSVKTKNALGRSRTCDPGVISTMLYRLSYESLHSIEEKHLLINN